MEIVVPIESSVLSGIGKIEHFFGIHGNEYLNKREQSAEYSFIGVFFYLVCSLCGRHFAAFQFHMDYWQAIYKQSNITSAFW